VDLNIPVIGISADSEESHKKFAAKFNLPFTLLCDPQMQAIKAFGVEKQYNLLIKKVKMADRVTFIINEEGIIEKVFEAANFNTNAADVLTYLKG